jgi:thiol-disulfide isomerase/thioredoxin
MLLVTTACNDQKDNFILKGEISNLSSDTILVLYQTPEYKLDTIFSQKGVFEYSFTPDTLTIFSLIFDNKEEVPIYANKGENVSIKGSSTLPTIKGEGENKLMNDILHLLRTAPKESIESIVDSLISTNVHSFTNLYLIDKYSIRKDTINYKTLKKNIEIQSGQLKDTPYLMNLQTRMEALNEMDKNKSIYALHAKERSGENIKWTGIKNKYILLSFWASWHPQSLAEQDSIQEMKKTLKNKDILIVSVALDINKEEWLKHSVRDTTQWKQVCDFKGWNNPIVKAQGIQTLPYNILLEPNKRILDKNIKILELEEKVKEHQERNNKKENKRR